MGGSDAHTLALGGARVHHTCASARDQGRVPGRAAHRATTPRRPLRVLYARLTERGHAHLRRRLRRDLARELRRGAAHPLRLAASAVLMPLLPLVPLFTLAIHAHELAFGRRHFRAFQEAFGWPAQRAAASCPRRAAARGGRVSVLAQVLASDDRLLGRVLEWKAPRWVRLWMLTATRLGDGWVWLATRRRFCCAAGGRGLRVARPRASSPPRSPTRCWSCVKRRVRRAAAVRAACSRRAAT